MATNHPDERPPASRDEDPSPVLPGHSSLTGHRFRTEARAELRDRETYYAELRFAVHCQSRSMPAPRMALEDAGARWDDMIARFDDAV